MVFHVKRSCFLLNLRKRHGYRVAAAVVVPAVVAAVVVGEGGKSSPSQGKWISMKIDMTLVMAVVVVVVAVASAVVVVGVVGRKFL